MFQLVVIYTFMTAACATNEGMASTTIVNSRYFYEQGGQMHEFPKVPPFCAPYRAYAYTKLDKYTTFQSCMERVARFEGQKDLKAICRKV